MSRQLMFFRRRGRRYSTNFSSGSAWKRHADDSKTIQSLSNTKRVKLRADSQDFQGTSRIRAYYQKMLNQQMKKKDWKAGIKLWRELKAQRVSPDEGLCSAVLYLCAQSRNLQLSHDMLAEMKALKLPLNMVCYNSFALIFKRTRQWELALTWLADMKQEGLQPDVFTYSTVMDCCVQNKEYEKAIQVYQEFLKTGQEPNAVIANLLIQAFGYQDFFKGIQLYEHFFEEGNLQPTQEIFGPLMQICFHHGKPDKAVEFYHKMKTAGLTPSSVHHIVLLKGLRHCKMYDAVEKTFSNIPVDDRTCLVYNNYLAALVDQERFEAAEVVWKECWGRGLEVSRGFFEQGIRIAVKLEDYESADELYRHALKRQFYTHTNVHTGLDLHFMSIPVAMTALRRALLEFLKVSPQEDFRISVGKGNHSEEGVSKLQNPVLKFFKLSDPPMECSPDVFDPGIFVVPLKSLLHWTVENRKRTLFNASSFHRNF